MTKYTHYLSKLLTLAPLKNRVSHVSQCFGEKTITGADFAWNDKAIDLKDMENGQSL